MSESKINPIETHYDGYKFRSRLEARWGVYFNALGVRYEYEKEGYDLGTSGWYLPDFWLPARKVWVEIKGCLDFIDDTTRYKARSLCAKTGHRVYVLAGLPKYVDMPAEPCYGSPGSKAWVCDGCGYGISCIDKTTLFDLWDINDLYDVNKMFGYLTWSDDDSIGRAVTAMKSARFEHRETP
jgi:hypothetical protein